MKTEFETQTLCETQTKIDITSNIKVSDFVYPNEDNRNESYHIFVSITGDHLDFNERQKEMVKVFVEAMKEELLTP